METWTSPTARDVTVAWSLIADPASHKSMLIKYNTSRVTLHHSAFVDSESRNPQVSVDDAGTPATDTTLDMRNNVVWGWGPGFGTLIHHGARANVVGNYYASPLSATFDRPEALHVCSGIKGCFGGVPAARARGYVAGNVHGDGLTDAHQQRGYPDGPLPRSPRDHDPCLRRAPRRAGGHRRAAPGRDRCRVPGRRDPCRVRR